jgi:hypothetical protein
MSHTLHRQGSRTSLQDDWVVLAIAAEGINKAGASSRLRRFLELAVRHAPVNFGDIQTGCSVRLRLEEILAAVEDTSVVHAVYTARANLVSFLRDLKDEGLGISVVLSGLFDETRLNLSEAGLTPHTISLSLGCWGRTERLPRGPVLDITTMCGHGMVPASLVEALAEDVRRGKVEVGQAARDLARPCLCGIFNQVRAARYLLRLAAD